jgi:hypothetical protein
MPPTTEAPPQLSSRRGRISECRGTPRLQALPLQMQRNASPFWIILLLICGECDYRMIRQNGIQRFESCRLSSQLRSRYIGAKSARESPHVGRFFGVTESLVRAISQQNLKSLVKVSGPYLENSRFAEPGGGDQFDLKLCGGFGSPGDATFRRCNLVRF